MAALSSPPKGDMTWNLGRPLVAAWLNASAGNDPSCIAETIAAAIEWLLAHPLGSGVGGGDPAWGDASGWAALLDDYNNGRLCAEHRDSGGGDVEASNEVGGPTTSGVTSPPTSAPRPPDDDANPGRHNGNEPSKQGPPNGKANGHSG
jgi:hypothetical protein